MTTFIRLQKYHVINEGVEQWCIREKLWRIVSNVFSGNSLSLSGGWKKRVGEEREIIHDKTLIFDKKGEPKWVDTKSLPKDSPRLNLNTGEIIEENSVMLFMSVKE